LGVSIGRERLPSQLLKGIGAFPFSFRAQSGYSPRPMTDADQSRPEGKPWIMGIHAYVPGKAVSADGTQLIKLSANENPLGTSEAAHAARKAVADSAEYPDPDARELRLKIGEVHGLDPARIVCGTGSDELLNLAAQGFAGPGDEVLFSKFSFSVYYIAARRCGATPVEAPDNDYATNVDALLAAVSDKTSVVFLANPNNPTGTYLPRSEVKRLHAGLPSDVLLVVDQAYAEYLEADEDDGGMELAMAHDNVLVTRTFSKIYGLAGERIGWATGAPHLIDVLNRIRGPFNVTSSGQAAAAAALDDQEFVSRSRDHNAQELARFTAAVEALGNHGLRPIPSKANFLLVLFEGAVTAEQALNAISDAGYAVRHLPGQGLPNALRITIGHRADMDQIAATLRALCGERA
jgi:histidinol-phosphate aminotransferase